MDANANDDSDLPDELKQKYTIAKLLGRYTLLNSNATSSVFFNDVCRFTFS